MTAPPPRGQEVRPGVPRPARPTQPPPLPPTSNGATDAPARALAERRERMAVGFGGEVITAAAVEQRILKLSDELEQMTYDLLRHANTAAEAEVAYKTKFAKTRLRARDSLDGHGPGGRVTNDEADDFTVGACENEYRAYLISQAIHGATRDATFTKRSQIDALRTIAANVRAQT